MTEKCDLKASYKRCASCPDKYHCKEWAALSLPLIILEDHFKLAELRKPQYLPDIVKTISHIRGLKVEPDEDYIVHIVSNVYKFIAEKK